MSEYINVYSANGTPFVEGNLVYSETDALEQIESYIYEGKVQYSYTVVVTMTENGRVTRPVNLQNELDEREWQKNAQWNSDSARGDDMRMERE